MTRRRRTVNEELAVREAIGPRAGRPAALGRPSTGLVLRALGSLALVALVTVTTALVEGLAIALALGAVFAAALGWALYRDARREDDDAD